MVLHIIVGCFADMIVYSLNLIPDFIPVGMFFGGILGLALYHMKSWQIINMKAIEETTQTQTSNEPVPLVVNKSKQSRVIASVSDDKQLQGYLLSGKDFDALSAYYASSDDRGFRRDDSASGKGAKMLCDGVTSSNFGMLRNALKVEGYIDDKNNWTSEGLWWLDGS